MKNVYVITLLILSFFISEKLFSEDFNYYIDTDFIIVFSSKKYNETLEKVLGISKKLNYPINFRNLEFNKDIGLSYTKASLEDENSGGIMEIYPWYDTRGRFNDGSYISREYTDKYEGFSKGYYIVIASSGLKGSLKHELKKIKKKYPDAYIKTSKIYIGPMD